MEQYPTEKSAEELAYEKANQKPEVYYKIWDTIYKTSFLFTDWCFRGINNGKNSPVPTLWRQASYIDYIAKKLYETGKIEEAIAKLEKMTDKIFQYNQERLKKEQEERE